MLAFLLMQGKYWRCDVGSSEGVVRVGDKLLFRGS